MADAASAWAGFRPDPAADAPLYLQLADRMADAIGSGALRRGAALPPERDFAAALGLSRSTIRRAVEDLAARGLVASRQGSGNYVAARLDQPLARLSGFSEDMRLRGHDPGALWLERTLRPPSPEEAAALGLPVGQLVAGFARVRLADGERLAIERAAVPAADLPDPDAVTASLYDVMAARGIAPARALQRLRAALASPADAALLDIAPGSPVMATIRHGYLADGRPIELTRSVHRGDRYDFVAEMRR